MTEAQRLAEWLDANSSSEEFQGVAERVAYLRRLEAECEALLTEARYITRQNGEWQEKATQAMAECEQLRAKASRYDWLAKRSHQNTAYDVFHKGGHWSIGFVSSDNRRSFSEAIDAAIAKETK